MWEAESGQWERAAREVQIEKEQAVAVAGAAVAKLEENTRVAVRNVVAAVAEKDEARASAMSAMEAQLEAERAAEDRVWQARAAEIEAAAAEMVVDAMAMWVVKAADRGGRRGREVAKAVASAVEAVQSRSSSRSLPFSDLLA